ncbi:MAG: YgiQ family radical SAM protein [Bacteroidales bacterium]|nr:YgiQ family radical SAM protein [Bacteroidales bacterium]
MPHTETKHFLPITKKEVDYLGWDYIDVVLVSGDAYIDHPSFCAAVIGRTLEKAGYRVAIVPQPNWKDDLRDFKKMGRPRLFFGVTSGNMDSMVNHYTARKRLRSNDAYTPGGVAGFRPDYATTVYSNILKDLFPDVPVVIGGIEASMRRLSHYDYWSDSLKPSILIDSRADVLVYGMGERPILKLAKLLESNDWQKNLPSIPQIAFIKNEPPSSFSGENTIILHSFEKEKENKKYYGENFVKFETESNKQIQKRIVQPYGDTSLVINPPFPPATTEEMDDMALFDRMMNLPHPKYAKRGEIPAFEMIKNSITIHRGCFGGCSFCAIAAHQGKSISSRSPESVLKEVEDLAKRDYFRGHISDLGAPSANMYMMGGKNKELCKRCPRPSCIFPNVCKNLNRNHAPLIALYRKAAAVSGIRHITIGSGIRYDMLLCDDRNVSKQNHLDEYMQEVIANHVSGRLKVAPEHTATHVLNKMRKPPFKNFLQFYSKFQDINQKLNKKQQLIPYFISSHPDCTLQDMKELSKLTRKYHLMTEQVQDFTPTPMTFSTALFFLGYDPYTGEKVYSAKSQNEKKAQNNCFFL